MEAATLAQYGQEHLLDGLDELPADARERFLGAARGRSTGTSSRIRPSRRRSEDVEPPEVVTLAEQEVRRAELREAGEDAYRDGRVAVLMVAGGQGTRLGWPGPKGTFPIGPHSGKTIYALQAEKVLALSRRVGRDVPLLVLTSPATDDETREHFRTHGDFGLAPGQVRPFVQGTVPSVDRDGRALLAEPGVLLENPDGHGGVFEALVRSGELERLRREHVEHLVYIQVDNVLAPVDDPRLVGLAALEGTDVVTKVLEKAHPDEKVGHLVRAGGRDRIVEYTELTPEDTRATTAAGELVYRWGSPALHAWSVDFLARLADRGYKPPLHRSAKPLRAWIDGAVRDVDGWKHERFVFDLVPEAEASLGIEIDREAEFAPVKNAEGAGQPGDRGRARAPAVRLVARGGGRRGRARAGRADRDQPAPRRDAGAVPRGLGRPRRADRPRAVPRLAAARREVLVVRRAGPAAAPRPAARGERLHEHAPGDGHARPGARAVRERPARRRRHPCALDVRVLDRVDVDRPAVGVLRPPLRPRRLGEAAVEAGGVVGRHRGVVAAAVGVDPDHPPDREARAVEAAEHGDDVRGRVAVDDELADPPATGEVPVREPEQPQLGRRDRAARPPRVRQIRGGDHGDARRERWSGTLWL